MKNQALFSSKDKSKKLKCHLLQVLYGALRVNAFQSQSSVMVHFRDVPAELRVITS